GANCVSNNPADAGNAAANCYYFNPFGSALQTDTAIGGANPLYVAELANRQDVVDHLFYEGGNTTKTDLFVVDAALDGELPFELAGGAPQWAVGDQYRRTALSTHLDPYFNAPVTPCTTPGDSSCLAKTGPFMFLTINNPIDVSQKTHSVFGELNLPFTDDIN